MEGKDWIKNKLDAGNNVIPVKVNPETGVCYGEIIPLELADNSKGFMRYEPNDNVQRETDNIIRINPNDKVIIMSLSGKYGDEFIVRCKEDGTLEGETYLP